MNIIAESSPLPSCAISARLVVGFGPCAGRQSSRTATWSVRNVLTVAGEPISESAEALEPALKAPRAERHHTRTLANLSARLNLGSARRTFKYSDTRLAISWTVRFVAELEWYAERFESVEPAVFRTGQRQSSTTVDLLDFFRRKTLMFNGYADEARSLYAGMDLRGVS